MPVSLKMQVVSGKGSLRSLMLIIWSLDQQHQYLGGRWRCRASATPRPPESEFAFSQVPQRFLCTLGLRSSDLKKSLKKKKKKRNSLKNKNKARKQQRKGCEQKHEDLVVISSPGQTRRAALGKPQPCSERLFSHLKMRGLDWMIFIF